MKTSRLKANFAQRPSTDAVLCGDALLLIPKLRDRSVNLCLTSPPYSQQRQRQYGGVTEKDYPAWMRRVIAALKPKLTDDGSVLIVIRPHLKDGVVSDYVLRTRLALRDDGWKENEELIWHKPDVAFFGSKLRLRRNSILWFSRVKNPYINVTATATSANGSDLLAHFAFATKTIAKRASCTRFPTSLVRQADPHFQP